MINNRKHQISFLLVVVLLSVFCLTAIQDNRMVVPRTIANNLSNDLLESVEGNNPLKVVVGGHSIGIKLHGKGIIIIETQNIMDLNEEEHNPGRESGLLKGDKIVKVDNVEVDGLEHFIELVKENKGKSLNFTVRRNDEQFETTITPIKSLDDGEYRFGLMVQDMIGGIGTLTFYDPVSGKFGALGHGVTDAEHDELLSAKNGKAVYSHVVDIDKSKKGKPGAIRGKFENSDKPFGELENHTEFGIFGKALKEIRNPLFDEMIEIGLRNEVVEGPAQIITTLKDNKIEAYDIIIEKLNKQSDPEIKSMVIKVVDKRLIKNAGGICQGMSGSPIIQNGKLVGAVSHVFVHSPLKGYAVYIEWMLEDAGIEVSNQKELAKAS